MSTTNSISGVVRVGLTFIFLTAGICKLTGKWSPSTHEQLVKSFKESFFPLWKKLLFNKIGLDQLEADTYRELVGGVEVISALMLWTGLKRHAALVLMCIMTAAAYTHLEIGESPGFPLFLGVASLYIAAVGGAAPVAATQGKKRQ